MKVALLASSFEVGGAERQIVALANALRDRGHDVTALALEATGPLADDLRGVPVVDLRRRGRPGTWAALRRLRRWLRDARPDVLHAYLPVPELYALAARSASPSTALVWGVRTAYIDHARYGATSAMVAWLERRLARRADLVVANSEAGARLRVAEGFPADRTVVIPNGIDAARFRPDEEARATTRAGWKVGGDEVVVGIVGRLDPMKDHATFLEAASIASRDEALRFVVVGDGPRDALARRARELGVDVLWAGSRRDMPSVYPALDVLVLSSYGEAFPNVVGEAMACGVPCVVTDVGDSAAVVGDAGRAVPPKAPDALARAVLDVVRADRRALGAAARERVVSRFGVEAMVDRTLAHYAQAVARRR